MKNFFIFLLFFGLKIVSIYSDAVQVDSILTPVEFFVLDEMNESTVSPSAQPSYQTMPKIQMSVGTYLKFYASDNNFYSALADTVACSVCESMYLVSNRCLVTPGILLGLGKPYHYQITIVNLNMIDYPQYNGDVELFTNTLSTDLHHSFLNGDLYNNLIRNSLLYSLEPFFTNESLINCTAQPQSKYVRFPPSFRPTRLPSFQPTNSSIEVSSADLKDDATYLFSTGEVVGIVIDVVVIFIFLWIAIYYLLKCSKKDSQSVISSKNVQHTSSQKSSDGAKYSSVLSVPTADAYVV
jgi:hypothetical protein